MDPMDYQFSTNGMYHKRGSVRITSDDSFVREWPTKVAPQNLDFAGLIEQDVGRASPAFPVHLNDTTQQARGYRRSRYGPGSLSSATRDRAWFRRNPAG